MPLVRFDLAQTLPPERVAALTDALHTALVETCAVPEADRFHIVTRHAPDGLMLDATFPNIPRSAAASVVQVTFRAGRSVDQKRALYRRFADLAEAAGHRREDLLVVLTENTSPDWSFGNGIAQYAAE
ncbi:MAG: tautomerase family protein [Alphaproteobacteria bacterium]|nr:tautomerase family protein [Alphaproteobacteria bacterium]TAD87600.1 MAG: tautomerase family protein [Alphaproteobacteria bacterium]